MTRTLTIDGRQYAYADNVLNVLIRSRDPNVTVEWADDTREHFLTLGEAIEAGALVPAEDTP